MKQVALLSIAALVLGACATPEQTERHRITCESYGHEPGTPQMASCIEKRTQQSEAAATRVGTSVLTNAILGAI